MRSLKLLLATILVAAGPIMAHAKKRSYVLPKKAQIIFDEVPESQKTAVECADFKLTAEQIREIFRTYKPITAKEQHDYYLWSPCTLAGKIIHKGKRYEWQARQGNTLTTDYPSGKKKTLGGARTDDPSGN